MTAARHRCSRRRFLGASAAAAVPLVSRSQPETEGRRLRVALIGTGGIGVSHIEMMARHGDICPCYCDVDATMTEGARERWPEARAYRDYREMFSLEADRFDAVMVGTPDHHHYPATVLALNAEKHVYTQKPLTHTVGEARRLREAHERLPGLVTQMGNQGHANEGNRLICEWVRSGAIGDVREIHCFTNRPVWPQPVGIPEAEDPVPSHFDWDLWLGPASVRPYREKIYHNFAWRAWWDFGTGALGDMACHTMDCAFWALELSPPHVVEPLAMSEMPEGSFPGAAVIRMTFEHEGRALPLTWYDGGLRPTKPPFLELDRTLSQTGVLIVGTRAAILSSGDYGDSPRIIPDAYGKEVGRPPRLLERSPGHYEEWRGACLGESPREHARSHFGYAGVMTEAILLGNLALRMGRRLEYDPEAGRVTNVPEANDFLEKSYREGWDFILSA